MLREGRDSSTPHRKEVEVREGDWRCKDNKCAFTNFARREVCMRCRKDRQGVLGREQGTLLEKPPMREAAEKRMKKVEEQKKTNKNQAIN